MEWRAFFHSLNLLSLAMMSDMPKFWSHGLVEFLFGVTYDTFFRSGKIWAKKPKLEENP
jgi:hypothetical protein